MKNINNFHLSIQLCNYYSTMCLIPSAFELL